MASIIGQEYKNADGWVVTDKIFGYMDKAGDIYNKIRYPQPGDPDYLEAEARLRMQNVGLFGLQKPWGIVLLSGLVAAIGFGIYRIATK